ncbi:E3 ubiquitin-protein ligase SDIR1-like [Durio zibethinus]|uniref:E3 ubiquitin-protein ligase SDIR1-like n=1 Tax=Durio zibethinus TaxID=66656 RepID=A0A6P6A7W8_DURZI|nr:E3 ubiquitin-protein ligase SDIR1-like [Durio zibethinus]
MADNKEQRNRFFLPSLCNKLSSLLLSSQYIKAGENSCFSHVSNMDMEDQQNTSLSSSMFEIEVNATFIIVKRNAGIGNEMLMEAGRIMSQVIHEFPLEDLINDGKGAILDMLNSMRVPVQPPMVEEIAATAVCLAAAVRDKDSKVLRMQVKIEAIVDNVPDFGNDDDTDDDDEGTVTTVEEVVEKVGKVVVEGSGKDCPICLEELVVGCEAACTPCSHVFHELCLVNWLNKKKRCPCCRFKLSR